MILLTLLLLSAAEVGALNLAQRAHVEKIERRGLKVTQKVGIFLNNDYFPQGSSKTSLVFSNATRHWVPPSKSENFKAKMKKQGANTCIDGFMPTQCCPTVFIGPFLENTTADSPWIPSNTTSNDNSTMCGISCAYDCAELDEVNQHYDGITYISFFNNQNGECACKYVKDVADADYHEHVTTNQQDTFCCRHDTVPDSSMCAT